MAEGPGSSAWLNRGETGSSQPPPYGMATARAGSFGQSNQPGSSDTFGQGFSGLMIANPPASGYNALQRNAVPATLSQLLANRTGMVGTSTPQTSWRSQAPGFRPQLTASEAQKIQQQKMLVQLASVPLHHPGAGNMSLRQAQPQQQQQSTPSQQSQSLQLPAGLQTSQLHAALQQLQAVSASARSPAPPPFEMPQTQQQGGQQSQQPMLNPPHPSHQQLYPGQQQMTPRMPVGVASVANQIRLTAPPTRALPQQPAVPPQRLNPSSSNFPPIRFAVDPASLPPLLPKIRQVREELLRAGVLPPEQRDIQQAKLQKQLYILLAAFHEQERRKREISQGVHPQRSGQGMAGVAQRFSSPAGRMYDQGGSFRGTPQTAYNMANLGLYNQSLNANRRCICSPTCVA